jgi:transposase-like protein
MEESKEQVVRKYRTKAAIQKLLQEQAQSGQNVKSFCAAHGIASGTFHRWKNQHGADEATATKGFATLQIASEPGLFAIVGSIRIYQPVSAAYLKELQS